MMHGQKNINLIKYKSGIAKKIILFRFVCVCVRAIC